MPKYIEEKELREWIQNWFKTNRYYHPYSKSNDIPIPELYDILERMPTADVPERNVGKWISVTERLPKLGEKVLVSTKHTVFTQVFKCIHGTPDRWGWEHNSIKKVTAWMPLPEPYKEKKDVVE